MGVDSQDFIKGLKAALNDHVVVTATREILCAPLLNEMRTCVRQLKLKKTSSVNSRHK